MDLATIKKLLKERIDILKKDLNLITNRKRLDKHLVIKREKNIIKYCIDDENKARKYINKNDKDTLRLYCQDRFLRKLEKKLPVQIKKMERAAGLLQEAKDVQQIYEELPEPVRKFATPGLYSEKELIEAFYRKGIDALRSSYEKRSENRTDRGEYVRSKSELIIANILYREGIPYDYERPVMLKSRLIRYPDFTVLNIRTGKEYLFEHFGMMDDQEYRFKNLEKIKDYENSGYIQGISLIMSFETKENPLDTGHIRKLIKTFFK